MNQEKLNRLRLWAEIQIEGDEQPAQALQNSVRDLIQHIDESEKHLYVNDLEPNPTSGDRVRHMIESFISGYHRENKYPPSLEEIADYIGLKDRSSVKHHIDMMENMNILTRKKDQNRTIVLTGKINE